MSTSRGSEAAIILELSVRLQSSLTGEQLFELLRAAETEIPRHAIHCPFKRHPWLDFRAARAKLGKLFHYLTNLRTAVLTLVILYLLPTSRRPS